MMYSKKLTIATVLFLTAIFLTASTIAQATEGNDFVPQGVGANSDTEIPYVPGSEGSNNPEGDGIIPNGQGGNEEEGDGSIIPNGQGSNNDEEAVPPEAADPISTSTPSTEDTSDTIISNRSSSSSRPGNSGAIQPPVSNLTNPTPDSNDLGSCIYINDYMRLGAPNNPAEVTKLQEFLSEYEGIVVPINGIFNQATADAVKAFQNRYLEETMIPWGWQTGSGIVSYTTKKKINEIYCKSTFNLTPEQLATIQNYRRFLLTPPAPASEVEEITPDEEPTVVPEIEVGYYDPFLGDPGIEAPIVAENTFVLPPSTQTAGVADASPGFLQNIINFFKNLF